jgi:hypothetical protein
MKFRFLQINEAYQKLHSVMESKEEPKDDQHELANFMRMVMDIVGISDGGNLPSGEKSLWFKLPPLSSYALSPRLISTSLLHQLR